MQKEDAELKEIALIVEFNTSDPNFGYNKTKGVSYGNRISKDELIPITAMLSPEEIQQLEKISKLENRSKSSLLRIAFLDYNSKFNKGGANN